MAFTTRDKVKAILGIPAAVTDKDSLIDDLIDEAHAIICEDIGVTAAAETSYTMSFDIMQTGVKTIALPHWPVSSITSVTTGVQGGGTGTVLNASDYYVTTVGHLRLQGASAFYPTGRQNVRVVWVAGFATDSKDFKSLALAERLFVVYLYNTGGRQGLGSEKIGRYSYKKDTGAGSEGTYPPMAERIISRYRTVFVSDPHEQPS